MFLQIGKLLDAISPAVTAVATGVIAWFTATIWTINRSQLKHGREVERAYISAGGLRRFVAQATDVAGQYTLTDTRQFEFHVNNYGKTRGMVFQLGWGFCESTDVPDIEPIYQAKYFRSEINPGASGVLFERIDIPQDLIQPAVYGRVYYETIFGDPFFFWFPVQNSTQAR
jgi:hypothetical protein